MSGSHCELKVEEIPIEAYQIKRARGILDLNFKKSKENLSLGNDDTEKKPDYRIAICQDGRFILAFDTGKINSVIIK